MIPIHLRISGFLSYRDPVNLDFTTFDYACISGQNGAGKSSLLDSITWALFGEARGKSSDIINLHPDVKAAEVALTFEHEGNTYRVQRTLPRNKSTILEFQVKTQDGWRPLTEKTTRDTQERIEQTLRLDYDTFVNASFFLQGKADQFTQQNPGKRKEVLSNILGLEMWEEYKNRSAERRKSIEREVDGLEARISEIDAELAEEDTRKTRLAELESTLAQLTATRTAQEAVLESIRITVSALEQQRSLVDTLKASLGQAQSNLSGLQTRLASREADRASYTDLVDRAAEIEAEYQEWQVVRADLEKSDRTASEFHEYDKERAPLLERIAVERTRLEHEYDVLVEQGRVIEEQVPVVGGLEAELEKIRGLLAEAEEKAEFRTQLESQRNTARERQAELKAENEALKTVMNQLKERIDTLKSAEGASCPLCGQQLSEEHRASTLQQLEDEGKQKGDLYRANQGEASDLVKEISDTETNIRALISAENERLRFTGNMSQLTERLDILKTAAGQWEATGKKRLKELEKILEQEKYAPEEHRQLAKLDKELAKLGYDATAHDELRGKESRLRGIEVEFSNLKSARDVSRQIDSEIDNLKSEIKNRESEIATWEAQYQSVRSNLAAAEAESPNLEEAERELFRLRENENRARSELGGARQRVEVLTTQRTRKAQFTQERESLQKRIVQHKTLEKAFGKDGVPALLIEQALPQIEEKSNELLDRLSDGQMSIRFVTQTGYKDKKRDDLRETLDIQISDSAGIRAYEMYSGGEAFRVNFAIRLALSEILAQRKGARLQTLVIDEGFGSQDTLGRQRLVEAINLVKNDFAKILVITHLDELKDVFPTRIEVEKTDRGSMVTVN
jgi:DNA repair protein SbcC/Rad50